MKDNYTIVKNILEEYGQEHLLNFYNELNEENKEELIEDILNIDFKQIQTLYSNINNIKSEKSVKIEKIDFVNKENILSKEKEHFDKIGENSIKNGEYAVVTMAGGQRNKVRSYRPKRHL